MASWDEEIITPSWLEGANAPAAPPPAPAPAPVYQDQPSYAATLPPPPDDPQAMWDRARQLYLQQPPPGSPPSFDYNNPTAFPNYDKLSPSERWLFTSFPRKLQQLNESQLGQAFQTAAGSEIGQAISRYAGKPLGKLLSYLDIPAEGAERFIGLMTQIENDQLGMDDLKAAWYASSLAGDVLNMPIVRKDPATGKNRVMIPNDLPGQQVGLAQARQRIQELVAGGMSYTDALKQTKETYYGNLGALATRAMMYDALTHIVADPLNIVLPMIKPVEKIHAARTLAMTQKVAGVKDLERLAQVARTEGRLEEAARITETIAKVGRGELKAMSGLDKLIISLTGGNPLDPATTGSKWNKINPFALTPESKAQEMTDMVANHIAAYGVAPSGGDPEKIAEFIQKAANGALGPEYGHAMLSEEGRMVGGYMKGIAAQSDAMLGDWRAVANERTILHQMAQALGDEPSNLLKAIETDPAMVADRLGRLTGGAPDVGALDNLAKVLKDAPLSGEQYGAQLMAKIEDLAMQQAIVKYGVSGRGLIRKWADTMKTAESLAFLGLTPGPTIRNLVNNEITILARGLAGGMPSSKIDDFWKAEGFIPARLKEGFHPGTMAGEKGVGEASNRLYEALRAGETGLASKIERGIKGFKSPIDFRNLMSRGESWASKRAMTNGYIEAQRIFSQNLPSVGDVISREALAGIRQADPGLARNLEQVARAGRGNPMRLDELTKGDMRLNWDAVKTASEQKLGFSLDEILTPELEHTLSTTLQDAMKEGDTAVAKWSLDSQKLLNDHVEDLYKMELEYLPERIAQQVQVGGPQVFAKELGTVWDDFWSAHTEQALRTTQAADNARALSAAGDYDRAGAVWEKLRADQDVFYKRMWGRLDASLEGLEKGAKAAGINMPAEVRQGFKDVRKTWKEFFDFRNKGYKELKGLKDQEYFDALARLQDEIDLRFDKAIDLERAAMNNADEALVSMAPPEMQDGFLSWRKMSSEMREQDRIITKEFTRFQRTLPPEERGAAWHKFWQDRQARYDQQARLDAAGSAMMGGSQEAADTIRAGAPPLVTPEDAASLPRSQLPDELSRNMEMQARTMLHELTSGQAGKQTAAASWKTTHPDWYEEIARKASKSRVAAALQKIIDDGEKDVGILVERLKEIGLGRIWEGDKTLGYPPDLHLIQVMGGDETALQKALGNFNDITGQNLTLEQAIAQSRAMGAEPEGIQAIRDLAKQFGIPTATPEGKPLDKRLLATINKYAETKFPSLNDVPYDVAEYALRARGNIQEGKATQFIQDYEEFVPDPTPLSKGLDQINFGRTQPAIDAMADAARNAGTQGTPSLLANLPPDLQKEVMRYLDRVKGAYADNRYAATRFAEFRRDSALLNYARRTNFDTWLGVMAPFAFWTTSSVAKWAMHSLDRPAMLTSYLRMKRLMETAGAPVEGLPSRLTGKMRVMLPFAPKWMGPQFIDPLNMALPFGQWAMPFNDMQTQQFSEESQAERLLDDRFQRGEMTQEEYNQAKTHTGPLWDSVLSEARLGDEDQKNAWDFASMMMSPHAPISWAYNAARGRPEDIGPFTPLSRVTRNVATMLGVDDWQTHPLNVEAKIRKQLGLPAFDKWDNYRIDRMLSNLSATGEFTTDEVLRAMILSGEVASGQVDGRTAQAQNPAYAEAVRRSNIEYSGGAAGTILGLLGISSSAYPTGEEAQRKLQDNFSRAYQQYDKEEKDVEALDEKLAQGLITPEQYADQTKALKGVSALTAFFDAHPEYETRLALWDTPQERMRKFTLDEMWSKWNALPTLTKKEMAAQLGPDFEQLFLNKETRAPDSISMEQMQLWLKLLGGDPPGTMTADQKMLMAYARGQLQLTDPETANRVDVFYETRKQYFEDFYDLQTEYFKYPEGSKERKQYLKDNPQLKAYWDWRRGWLATNPDIAPYLTDNEEDLIKLATLSRVPGVTATVPTAQEIMSSISPYAVQLLQAGGELPPVMWRYLEQAGQQYGLTAEQVAGILTLQQQEGQPLPMPQTIYP